MKPEICCKREMYQEIGKDNILLSICRICGKELRTKVSFSGRPSDHIEYFTEASHLTAEKQDKR